MTKIPGYPHRYPGVFVRFDVKFSLDIVYSGCYTD